VKFCIIMRDIAVSLSRFSTSSFRLSKVKIVHQPLWNSSTRLNKMNDAINDSLEILTKDSLTSKGGWVDKNDKNNILPKEAYGSEIITGIKIYDIWSKKLSQDKISAEIAWSRCRKLAGDALEAFKERMEGIEAVITDDISKLSSLDVDVIIQKKREIEAAAFEIEDLEIEFKEVSKAYQNVAQFLPDTEERKNIKNELRETRKRYFVMLDTLARKKEIFRMLTPLLEQYKEIGTDIKSWLDSTEVRSERFLKNYNNEKIVLENEEALMNIYNEIYDQKDVYENFLEAAEAILDVNPEAALTELQQDIDETIQRWDILCSNLEKCLNRLKIAKKLAEKNKKNDVEKIEQQIRSESKMCTCHKPFQITKVGDGKYTFGSSKIVRLLRIHGSSIVVRVGGGWEYLYDFLLKTDPCRAKQYNKSKRSTETFNLSGLDLTPIDKTKAAGEFNLNVRRMSHSWKPYHGRKVERNLSGSLGSAASSSENMDTCDESSDSFSLSTSTGCSTPQPTQQQQQQRPKLRKHASEDKLSMSGANKNNQSRRLSLIERQTQYAEKRKSLQFLDKIPQ